MRHHLAGQHQPPGGRTDGADDAVHQYAKEHEQRGRAEYDDGE
ncbi:hypothetical protein [Dactylosporangium sp. NPDC000521]